MRGRLELSIENNRAKLKGVEDKITSLNIKYMDLLDKDEDSKDLKKIEAEINYLERQQDIIIRTLRDRKRQLRELNV